MHNFQINILKSTKYFEIYSIYGEEFPDQYKIVVYLFFKKYLPNIFSLHNFRCCFIFFSCKIFSSIYCLYRPYSLSKTQFDSNILHEQYLIAPNLDDYSVLWIIYLYICVYLLFLLKQQIIVLLSLQSIRILCCIFRIECSALYLEFFRVLMMVLPQMLCILHFKNFYGYYVHN